MKKKIIFICILFWSLSCFTQTLSVSIDIIQKPACRTAGFQSGNGYLSGTANGGIGNYLYTWYDNTISPIGHTPLIHIQKPGLYHLAIIDDVGDSAITSVHIDSINPLADFEVNSNDFLVPDVYLAHNSAEVSFTNTSSGSELIITPFSDLIFEWNLNASQINNEDRWFYTYDYITKPDTTYLRVEPNHSTVYKACLIAKNYNDCRDTACKFIQIVDPNAKMDITITPNYSQKNICFETSIPPTYEIVRIYDTSGKLVSNFNLNASLSLLQFDNTKGIYLYTISLDNEMINTGKFIF